MRINKNDILIIRNGFDKKAFFTLGKLTLNNNRNYLEDYIRIAYYPFRSEEVRYADFNSSIDVAIQSIGISRYVEFDTHSVWLVQKNIEDFEEVKKLQRDLVSSSVIAKENRVADAIDIVLNDKEALAIINYGSFPSQESYTQNCLKRYAEYLRWEH